MLPQCAEALTQAAGRDLTKAELRGIDERMHASMLELARKDRAAFAAMPKDVRLRKAAEIAKANYEKNVADAQARTVRDMAVKVRQTQKLESFKPGLHGQLAALGQRLWSQNHFKGGDVPLEVQAEARFQQYASNIDNRAEKGSYWGLMQNIDEQESLFMSMFGRSTGNPEHARFGQAVQDVVDQAFQEANDVGIPIRRRADWSPRHWAWEDVAADREQFAKDALAEIDPRDYVREDSTQLTPEELHRFVAEATDTIASNGANKDGEGLPEKGGRGIGARRNAPRQLVFKSPEAEYRMWRKYGADNNVMSLVHAHLRSIAKDITVAEMFGRDAPSFVKQLVQKAFDNDLKTLTDKGDIRKLERLRKYTLKVWDAYLYPGSPGDLPLWAKISDTIRGVVTQSLLGAQVFSSLPDNAMSTTYGLHIGLTRRQLLGNKLEGLSLRSETKDWVRRQGFVRDIVENGTDRYGSGELNNWAVRFMNHAMHVLSSMRRFDRGQVHSISAGLMDLWGKNITETPFSRLADSDAKYLAARGITADHYRVWRMADLDRGPDDNHHMLTARNILAIPDEKIRPIAEQRMSAVSEHFKAEVAKREAANAKANEWVAGRINKLADLKAKADATLSALTARASVKGGHDQGVLEARAEQLRAEVDRAAVESDIGRYLQTESTGNRARTFLDAVEEGAAVERQTIAQRDHPDNRTDAVVQRMPKTPAIGEKMQALIQRYGRDVGAKAEALGQRQARTEARIAAAQKRVDAAAKERAGKIDAKRQQFEKRIQNHLSDLHDFTARMRQRAQERADQIAMFERQHGAELDRETRKLRAESANRLMSMVLADAKIGARGASGNNVRDQIALGITPDNADTIMGQALRWLLLLKQTPIGIFRTHMIDVPRGIEGGWTSRLNYRAQYIARGLAWGAATVALKSILLGNDPDNMASMKGLAKIAIASGGGGMYGDFLFGDTAEGARHGYVHNGLVKLAGPGASMFSDAYDLFARSKAELGGYDGRPGTFSAKWLKFMHSYGVPFGRLWYIKAAQNHLIYQKLMDELNPGYTTRIRQRMMQNRQSAWWKPGAALPHRAPDLGAAVRPER